MSESAPPRTEIVRLLRVLNGNDLEEENMPQATEKILAAYDALAAERDEWKRRAEALGYQGGK